MDDLLVGFANAVRGMAPKSTAQVQAGIVKSVTGQTCTIELLSTEFEQVETVSLRADEDASEGVLLIPRIGSLVYVAKVDDAIDHLFVCHVSEVERVEAQIGKTRLSLDAGRVHLEQNEATLTLSGNRVAVAVGGVSLASLFADLTGLLNDFKVVCSQPGTPSAAVFPATLTKIAQLKTNAQTLLQ